MAPPSKYSPEFREEAVQLALKSNKPIAHTARVLGLNSETLRSWVRRYEKESAAPAADLGVDDRARLREIERRVRELEMENSS